PGQRIVISKRISSRPEGGEEFGRRCDGRLAEGGFEDGGVGGAGEGVSQLVVHRESAGSENRVDGLPQALDLSLGTDFFQAAVALTLEEIAEDHPARRLAVVESLH